MKFLDWAEYIFLSPHEKEAFKNNLRRRQYERELQMFHRQNLAGAKICLSLFREQELEDERNMILGPDGRYHSVRGDLDDIRPSVKVVSKNLPDNAFVKPEKIRVGLSSILRDDVEIRQLSFAKFSIGQTVRPHPSAGKETLPGWVSDNVWAAKVRRGDSEYYLKIEGQRVTVYSESCQPKIKEYKEGYKLVDERSAAATLIKDETVGESAYDHLVTRVKPMYEYRGKQFKLCGGVQVISYEGYRPGQGGGSSEQERTPIDLKTYNTLKNEAVLAKLSREKGKVK